MDSTIVYSTRYGRMCPDCAKPFAQCECRRKKTVNNGDGIVRVGRETKGRKGKCVTVIKGVPLDYDGLLHLAKQLKQHCGAGGTVKGNIIEIQGDHREMTVQELTKLGYTAKRSG